MLTCFRIRIIGLLCPGLISGCAVWSSGPVMPVDAVARVTDETTHGSTEIVVVQRTPEAGGDLTIGWVPLATVEASMGDASKTPDSNSISVKSLLENFEYCKIKAVMPSTNPGKESDSNSSEMKTSLSVSTSPTEMNVAGRVVSVDDNSIVLADAVAIDGPSAITVGMPTGGMPTGGTIPFTSRMFKNSGILVQRVSIPGEVHIELRNVKVIESIDAAVWPSIRPAHFERIGIDFDFNVLPSRRVLRRDLRWSMQLDETPESLRRC